MRLRGGNRDMTGRQLIALAVLGYIFFTMGMSALIILWRFL